MEKKELQKIIYARKKSFQFDHAEIGEILWKSLNQYFTPNQVRGVRF